MRFKQLLLITMISILGACGTAGNDIDNTSSKGSNFVGYVVDKINNRILVADPNPVDYSSSGGVKNFYSAIWFGNSPSNVEVGHEVEVWVEGEIQTSYPGQGQAERVTIVAKNVAKNAPAGATKTEKEVIQEALSSRDIADITVPIIKNVEFDISSMTWTVYIAKNNDEHVLSIQIEDHPQVNNIIFPEVVSLAYEKVTLEPINDKADIMGLEKQKSVSFGVILGESIKINLYANGENSSSFTGVLHFKNNTYMIHPIGYSRHKDSIETYIIQEEYAGLNGGVYLIGAIGSPALGYQYVFYDEGNNEWLTYHNWGIPEVYDINNDGTDEVLMQFQGTGLNAPDVNILSWVPEGFLMVRIKDSFDKIMKWEESFFIEISSTITDAENSGIAIELFGNLQAKAFYKFEALDSLRLK